ncbi:MAG: DegQ family serine endoprotease [Desulfobacterales bacterium]|nr:MAG: DegQ family serine endoprotease [Desulfobacterales bacterium]
MGWLIKGDRYPRWPAMVSLRGMTVGFLAILFIGAAAQAKEANELLAPANFSRLAEKISPAVVNIRTVKTLKGGGPVFRHFNRGPWEKDQPFKDFFERFFGDEMQREFKQPSLGSGFIIDKDGYVVTNNHVIEDADQIKVRLKNEEEYDAEIIGRDPNTDLALIKIKSARDLPVIPLGDSDQIKVGQWVVAIGSPFGLEHTVTAGIVSAKGRVIGSGPYDDFIQTDASINPGNSGGPLVNLQGEVVGINAAIIASGQGIGFAIPVNLAKGILAQLKDQGEVTRGWLGVAIQDLSPDMADYYGLKDKKGVFVADVFKGDPADVAGIQTGDIIFEVNGQRVKTSRELTGLIAGIGVGEKVSIKAWREGREKTFEAQISKRDGEKIAATGRSREKEEAGEEELGLRVSDLTPEIAQRFNLGETTGVIVIGVESGSKAAQAGMQIGDIIKEINHQATSTVKAYAGVLGKIKAGEAVQMFIWRKNAGFLVIKLEK